MDRPSRWSGPVLAGVGALLGSAVGASVGIKLLPQIDQSSGVPGFAGIVVGTIGGLAIALTAAGIRRILMTPVVMVAILATTGLLGVAMLALFSTWGFGSADVDLQGVFVLSPALGLVAFTARLVVDRMPARGRRQEGAAHHEIGTALQRLGMTALAQGAPDEARTHLEESLTLARQRGDRGAEAAALHDLALVARVRGDLETAKTLALGCLAISRQLGERRAIAAALSTLGSIEVLRGDPDAAAALHGEAMVLRRDLGDRAGVAEALEGLAIVAAARGRWRRAARLVGAAAALREVIGSPAQPFDRERLEGALAAVRATAEPEAFSRAESEGRDAALEDSIAYALEEPPGTMPAVAATAEPSRADEPARASRPALLPGVALGVAIAVIATGIGGGAIAERTRRRTLETVGREQAESVWLKGSALAPRLPREPIVVVTSAGTETTTWRAQFRSAGSQVCLEAASYPKAARGIEVEMDTIGTCWTPAGDEPAGTMHYCVCPWRRDRRVLIVAARDAGRIGVDFADGRSVSQQLNTGLEMRVAVGADDRPTVYSIDLFITRADIGYVFAVVDIGDAPPTRLTSRAGNGEVLVRLAPPKHCAQGCASDSYEQSNEPFLL